MINDGESVFEVVSLAWGGVEQHAGCLADDLEVCKDNELGIRRFCENLPRRGIYSRLMRLWPSPESRGPVPSK